jgi:hypothetical protein
MRYSASPIVRLVNSLKPILLYALCGTFFAACAGSVSPMTSGGGAGVAVVPSTAGAVARAGKSSRTFHYAGKKQTFKVPPGVNRITVTALGAGAPSAYGGLVEATIPVQPGESLAIFVGGAPNGMEGGYNGGGSGGYCDTQNQSCPLAGQGGAGASDVRQGGSSANDRVLVAGGGGGGGGEGQHHGGRGGAGGGLRGTRGHAGTSGVIASIDAIAGGGAFGTGGTQRDGGAGGKGGAGNHQWIVQGLPGADGVLASGGTGGSTAQGYNLAGGAGGGGGGGYYGGGGGGSGANATAGGYSEGVGSGGGGGGGSSFVEKSATHVTIEEGRGSDAAGLIVIYW